MPDTVITQTISTTDAQVLVNCGDNPLVSIEVSGTWAGALNIETNLDPDNPIWRAGKVFTEAGAAASAAPTANGRWIIQAAGVGQVRARLNPATSGAAVVTLRAGDNETFGLSGGGGGGGGGPVTAVSPGDFVDGWDATQGLTSSAGIITDVNGTAQGFRRGNIKMWLNFLARLPAALVSGRLDVNIGATAVTQPVSATALPLPTGASTEATLASVLAKIIAAPATEATLASILAKIIAAPATEATLALIKTDVDKIPPLTGPYPSTGFAPAAPTCTFTRAANQVAYTIGDEVGTAGTAPTTIPVGRVNGGSGIIQSAIVFYSEYPATIPQLVLLVFNATVTLAGDNAQLLLSDADAAKIVAVIPLTASQSTQYSAGAPVSGGGVWLSGTPARPAPHFVCGGGEQTLYCCLITLNAWTPLANSTTAQVFLDVEQN